MDQMLTKVEHGEAREIAISHAIGAGFVVLLLFNLLGQPLTAAVLAAAAGFVAFMISRELHVWEVAASKL